MNVLQVVGIDAYKWGWVAVALEDGRFVEAAAEIQLAHTLARYPHAAAVAIDIPIGLAGDGWRRADDSARERLGRRWRTVFRIPPLPVWEADNYADAAKRCRELTGSGMSRQTFGLRERLLEANGLVGEGRQLYEVHPEVCFDAMGAPPGLEPKRSWSGQMKRRRLLDAQGISLPDDIGDAGVVPADDILDAAAVAWTANRIAEGRHATLPGEPEAGEPRISY